MAEEPAFDVAAANKHFAAECFNKAWDYIDKPERTAEDDEQMLLASMASAWHWSQCADGTPQNMSVAFWQLSHIYALLGQADDARCFGERSLAKSQVEGVPPFFLAYAYEALARAEMIAGDRAKMAGYLREAMRTALMVEDLEAQQMLMADLKSIT